MADVPTKLPSAVVIAVRDKFDALRKQLPSVEAEARGTAMAARSAAQRLEELNAQLSVLSKFLESQADEPPAPQNIDAEPGAAQSQETSISTRSINLQILLRAKLLLGDGKSRNTMQILRALSDEGVNLVASNPMQRLSQLLSTSPDFVNDRQSGWSLKGEDPAPTGSSGATKSERDEP